MVDGEVVVSFKDDVVTTIVFRPTLRRNAMTRRTRAKSPSRRSSTGASSASTTKPHDLGVDTITRMSGTTAGCTASSACSPRPRKRPSPTLNHGHCQRPDRPHRDQPRQTSTALLLDPRTPAARTVTGSGCKGDTSSYQVTRRGGSAHHCGWATAAQRPHGNPPRAADDARCPVAQALGPCGGRNSHQVLVAVAGRLTRATRDGDLVVRLGGDEFILVLTTADPAAIAQTQRGSAAPWPSPSPWRARPCGSPPASAAPSPGPQTPPTS